MKLGEYIKHYRTIHDLSQRQFASMCGLSYGYISMLEKGVNTSTGAPIVPTLQTMKSLATGMGRSVHALLSEIEDMELNMSNSERQPTKYSELSEEEVSLIEAFRSLGPLQQEFVLRSLLAQGPK